MRIISLVVYVALPVAGILWWGWDWRSVILLYWLENITVGIANVISMSRAPLVQVPGASPMTFNDSARPAGRAGLILFFLAHYGLFTLVHGVFVLVICGGGFGFGSGPGIGPSVGGGFLGDLALIDWNGILLVWGVGSIVQLVAAVIAPRDRIPPVTKLFWGAYPRIFALHLTVLGGVWLIERLGWPPVAAILLVVLHFVFDLVGAFRSRTSLGERPKVM